MRWSRSSPGKPKPPMSVSKSRSILPVQRHCTVSSPVNVTYAHQQGLGRDVLLPARTNGREGFRWPFRVSSRPNGALLVNDPQPGKVRPLFLRTGPAGSRVEACSCKEIPDKALLPVRHLPLRKPLSMRPAIREKHALGTLAAAECLKWERWPRRRSSKPRRHRCLADDRT